MPTVSWFFGIAIRMYFEDHGRAHFHAYYGSYIAVVDIETGEILRGKLPPAARRLVGEWCALRRAELMDNWRRIRANQSLEKIPGLDNASDRD